jgi:hypothetical protein
MLVIFFNIKGIVHKQFVLVGQTVNSAYYCKILRRLRENVRKLRSEIWRQKNWLLHHDNAPSHTSFLIRESLTKNNMTVVPHLPKLKCRHFDNIKMMETESQVVLNTLTEHNFQDAFVK